MPTIAYNGSATIYSPLQSTVTVTPSTGTGRVTVRGQTRGGVEFVNQTITAALDVSMGPGSTMTIACDGIGATYTEPVGLDTSLQALVSTPGNSLRAWRAQKKLYTLKTIPTPTIYIDFNRGSDSNNGSTPALAYKNLTKLLTALPAAGACIALANDSTFDLTTRLSFSVAGSTAINGTSESARITFTNYDPGGYPTQRPRIRFRYLPTDVQWTWDAGNQQWYYTNPNARNFNRDSLIRIPSLTASNGWGEYLANGAAITAITRDGQAVGVDATDRLYLYAPAGTDPTTYYGGANSVILGEDEGAAISFSRCGKFVTIDNIVFEECGLGVSFGNFSGTESLSGFVVQRCSFINCGTGVAALSDTTSAYTMSWEVMENEFRSIGASSIRSWCKALNCRVAGNYFDDINNSMSAGGGLYVQESSGGTTGHGNNFAYQNYIGRAKHNRGNAPYDGCGLYIEVGGKGWELAWNFFSSSHQGIYVNSGTPVVVHHNVFDDVDIPYSVSDANSIAGTNSTFVYNTLVNVGLTKYRTSGALDNVTAAINVNDNIGSGKTIDHRNNIIHMIAAGRAQNIRTGSTYNAESNHLAGAVTDALYVGFNGAGSTSTPAGTTVGEANPVDPAYAVTADSVAVVGPGVALTAFPVPRDIYGNSLALPVKGAVS